MTEILIAVAIVSAIGLISGIMLTVFSKLFAVPVDETAEKVAAVLPGANCGGCGFSGCAGYAEAVASGKAVPDLCSVGGADVAARVAEIVGKSVTEAERRVAVLRCSGTCDSVKKRFQYEGIQSCAAAASVHGGDSSCEYGCLGYGDCVAACQFGALSLKNGIPDIDTSLCTACGKCVEACPKSLMRLRPISKVHTVACHSRLKGALQRKLCTAGCIGCGKCARVCPASAITVENNLAKINYSLCTACGACKESCPAHCIL